MKLVRVHRYIDSYLVACILCIISFFVGASTAKAIRDGTKVDKELNKCPEVIKEVKCYVRTTRADLGMYHPIKCPMEDK